MSGNLFQFLLQLTFLLVLYLFVARVIRAILIDVYGPRARRPAGRARGRARPPAAPTPSRSTGRGPRQLVVNDLNGQRSLPLADSVTIGRAASCDLVVADNYVSNMHTRIYADAGSYWVEDMGSTNGTYVNGRQLSAPVEIGPGDEVRVGKATLELRR